MIALTDLIRSLGQQDAPQDAALFFSGLSCDSRNTRNGDVFVVVPCDQARAHAREAVQSGAKILIAEPDFAEAMEGRLDVPIIAVPSARLALSKAASLFYPGQPETVVAVTGTNGKSSVVAFVRQIWENLGLCGASLGTLGLTLTRQAPCPNDLVTPNLTTPDALSFHRILDKLASSSITHCAFESSSHGLEQYRSHSVRLATAGFTNLSQDHLDYHGTMDAYFEAKARLFTEVLPAGKTAVVNRASPYFPSLKAMVLGRGQNILTYGVNQTADLMAHNIRLTSDQIYIDLAVHGTLWRDIPLNMVGGFQVENILCAMGLVLACGDASPSTVVDTLSHIRSAPGRMELAGKTRQGSPVFIDYAHTPDALSRALQALRHHVEEGGQLKVVFGCGGNRDAGKRAQMGEIACELADVAYVTDDNPRNEDPAFIRAQILTGCPTGREIGDRRQAIQQAIQEMGPKDVLLVAGKGHEQGQILGDRTVPFDDRQEVQAILRKHPGSEVSC